MRRRILLLAIVFVFLLFSFHNSLFSTVYGSIYGKVIDEETGKGVKGVKISLFQPGFDFTITAETNENGEFIFPEVIPGRCRIGFWPPSPYAWPLFKDRYQTIYLERGKNLYIVKKLKHGGVIEGRVYDISTGAPIEEVEIQIVGGGPNEYPVTDASGKFRMDRLYPGKYEVIAWRIGYGMKTKKDVEVKTKEITTVEIPFDSNDPTRVSGEVRCIDSGEIVKEVLVYVERKDEYGWSNTYTDKNGRYLIIGLEPGIYEIGISADKKINGKVEEVCFSKTVNIHKGKTTIVNLEVDCSSYLPFKKEKIQ